MRDLCFAVARKYRLPKTDIVDLGCSRGEAIARLIDEYGAQNRFVGVEVSKPMLEGCRVRFKDMIDASIVDIHNMDLVDPVATERKINNLPGVVTCGLFAIRSADIVLMATARGVQEIT